MLKPFVFSTRNYEPFAQRLMNAGGFEAGKMICEEFPDGEIYHRILSEVEERDVVVVGGTVSEMDTLELYDIASGLVACGARRLSMVIPYFGYSTMERDVNPGEIVKAKTRARLLSSIPAAGFGNKIFLMDLHSEGIPNYFEGPVHPIHVYAKPVIIEALENISDDFVFASTDSGRAKWVESLANDMGKEAAFAYKRRVSGSITKTLAIRGDVKGKIVVIYDDMIRTGSSLLGAAKAYLAAGATKIYVISTHGVFPKDALERIQNSGIIDKIICTDTHCRVELLREKLEVHSVVHLFVPHLLKK